MPLRRMLPFLLLNVFVSAAVVLAILYWWDGQQQLEAGTGGAQAPAAAVAAAATAPRATAGSPAAEQPAATPEAAAEPLVHVVKTGDTLGNLSQLYEVTMEDIMAANDISNPNLLSVGQELTIPVGGLPTTEPETGSPAAPTTAPTLPAEGGEAILRIADVTGPGQLAQEVVLVVNDGESPVSLQGWQIADEQGHVYLFGQITLFGAGSGILIHTGAGDDVGTDLFWGLEEATWQSGEVASLLDAGGALQASLAVP